MFVCSCVWECVFAYNMGGSLSQLPLADSNSTVDHTRNRSQPAKKQKYSDEECEEEDVNEGPGELANVFSRHLGGVKSEQSLTTSEHALFTAWNKRSNSAGDPTYRVPDVSQTRTTSVHARASLARTDKGFRGIRQSQDLPTTSSEQTVSRRQIQSSQRKHSLAALPGKEVKDGLVYQIRAELFRELAAVGESGTVDNKELALSLDNRLIRDIIQELVSTNQPITQAVPRLMQILQERAGMCRMPAGMTGILHICDPRHHDSSLIALHALSILTYGETNGHKQALAMALRQIETSVREDTRGVDLVVDFTGLSDSGLRTNGAGLIRRIIADAAGRRNFCKRVFFIDFPDDYRLHCARWRNELPRNFRRRIWCVTSENLEHVLPDYISRSRVWHESASKSSAAPGLLPTVGGQNYNRDFKLAVSRSRSSIGGLVGIVETSSRNLLFRQMGSQGRSEAEFTIRNVNQTSFVVCRFLSKRPIYSIVPSRTFLLPYPKRQTVTIFTNNDLPIKGDVIRLQIYILHLEDGRQIPYDTDADTIRHLMGDLKHEIVLKRGCDLVVANIVRADGDHSEGDLSACDLFEKTACETAEWDGGNESGYDWTADSTDGYGDPLCATVELKSVKMPIAELTQTTTIISRTADIQTDAVPVTIKGVSFSTEVQTDTVAAPSGNQSFSAEIQTDGPGAALGDTRSRTIQTEVFLGTAQSDTTQTTAQSDVTQMAEEIVRVTRSGLMQTDLVPVRSGFIQTNPLETFLRFVQTDPEIPQSANGPIFEPKVFKSTIGQTLPPELKPVASGMMQTDAVPDTVMSPLPKAMRSASGQTLQATVSSRFLQTEEENGQLSKAVKSAVGQTEVEEIRAPLKSSMSGNIQTEPYPVLKLTKSETGQTESPAFQLVSMQTDEQPKEVKSEFNQTLPVAFENDPPPLKLVSSGFMQTDMQEALQAVGRPAMQFAFGLTDEQLNPEGLLPKIVRSAIGPTDNLPIQAGEMQTDEMQTKMVQAGFAQTDEEVRTEFGHLIATQTNAPPAVTLGETQTDRVNTPPVLDLRSHSEGTNQTDRVALTDTAIGDSTFQTFALASAQTDIAGRQLAVTQTDSKEKSVFCPAVPGVPIKYFQSGLMQTTELVKTAIDQKNTQTDPPNVDMKTVWTDKPQAGEVSIQAPSQTVPAQSTSEVPAQAPPQISAESPVHTSNSDPMPVRETDPLPPVVVAERAHVSETVAHHFTRLNDTVRNVSLPSWDLKPFGILATILALAWLAYWLELHEAVGDYSWVTDWSYPYRGSQVASSGSQVASRTATQTVDGGGSSRSWFSGGGKSSHASDQTAGTRGGGSDWSSGGNREAASSQQSSSTESRSWFGGGGRASQSASPNQQAGLDSSSHTKSVGSWFGGGSSQRPSATHKAEGVTGQSWSHDRSPDRISSTASPTQSKSWFGGEGEASQPALPNRQAVSGSSGQIQSGGSWFGGESSQQSNAAHEAESAAGYIWPSDRSSDRMSSPAQHTQTKSWFGGQRTSKNLVSSNSVSRQQSFREPSGNFASQVDSGDRHQVGASSRHYGEPAANGRTSFWQSGTDASSRYDGGRHSGSHSGSWSITSRQSDSISSHQPAPNAERGHVYEGDSQAQTAGLPGFETTSYRGAFWSSGNPSVSGSESQHVTRLEYSGSGLSYRGVNAPPYTGHNDQVPSLISKFFFGTPLKPSSAGPKKLNEHKVAEFNPEMVSTWPVVRGLEMTTPELGTTKQWLHSFPFRFDPGKLECWNGLRSNPNYLNRCLIRNDDRGQLHKKRCVDQFFSIEHYATCRIAAAYDHKVWGV